MNQPSLPLILEPDTLEEHLSDPQLLIVDLSKAETYRRYHVPGAVYLDYPRIIRVEKPVMGLLPHEEHLSKTLSAIGLNPETHVIAYDDEGGGKACRLLWTLEVMGHRRYSLLNGGLHAWANEDHRLESNTIQPRPGQFEARNTGHGLVDKQYLLDHLRDPSLALLDARTPEEYHGQKRLAARSGHIPGAVNLNWLETMDKRRNLRLLPEQDLKRMLEDRGITPDKEVVTYCQSHHRSAHSYIMLKSLGYERIAGYPGAWSEWGNDQSTPIE